MKYLICWFLVFLCVQIFAQGKLSFEEMNYDFGEIKEEDGYAEYTFKFVNDGSESITISRVKASCGCTTPAWTKEEVQPGDSGIVTARYNPRNRPGKFRKSLRITTSTPGVSPTLYINGYVRPKPKSIDEELPIAVGDLRLKYRSLNFGKITTEKNVERQFDVYNSGADSIELNYQQMKVPNHLLVSLEPEKLAPRNRGYLKVIYDPSKKNDLGFVSDSFTLSVDSLKEEKFSILTTIEEYFPELSAEELDQAPKLSIKERVADFGKVESGQLVELEFELANDGKEKLNIRKIKSNCDCVTYQNKSENIKKGRSQTLKVKFDTTGRKGNQYKTITLFTNDPSAPTQMVTIKGVVNRGGQ